MKKLLVITLLSLHLFGNTEFYQVFQVRQLLVHYYHHLQVSQVSFGEFLAVHYGSGDNIQTDDAEEREMPFLQIHQHAYSYAVLPQAEKLPANTTCLNKQVSSLPLFIIFYSFDFRGSPFKPPRGIGSSYL